MSACGSDVVGTPSPDWNGRGEPDVAPILAELLGPPSARVRLARSWCASGVRAIVLHTRGMALSNAGRLAEARDQLAAAADGLDDPEAKVSLLITLADLCDRMGDHDAATRHRVRALAESEGYESPGMTKLQRELTAALRLSA